LSTATGTAHRRAGRTPDDARQHHGGEPLVRKDVGELVDHLKARHHVAMNTTAGISGTKDRRRRQARWSGITLDGPQGHNDGSVIPAHTIACSRHDHRQVARREGITMTVE